MIKIQVWSSIPLHSNYFHVTSCHGAFTLLTVTYSCLVANQAQKSGIDHLFQKFANRYQPDHEVIVDEVMIRFQGQSSLCCAYPSSPPNGEPRCGYLEMPPTPGLIGTRTLLTRVTKMVTLPGLKNTGKKNHGARVVKILAAKLKGSITVIFVVIFCNFFTS